MGNMSYCRFENTSSDLYDCVDALSNMEMRDGVLGEVSEYSGEWSALSEHERDAANEMKELCERYLEIFENLS